MRMEYTRCWAVLAWNATNVAREVSNCCGDVRVVSQCTIFQKLLRVPPSTISYLYCPARLCFSLYEALGPFDSGCGDPLPRLRVQAVNGGVVANGLDDIQRILGIVILDHDIQERRAGKLETDEGGILSTTP